MIVSLIGFMGCGKSSVGRRLSELLYCPFMDLDAVIEQKVDRTIPEIFATDGEAAFRQLESDALNDIITRYCSEPAQNNHPVMILSLGGGTVTQQRCAEIVKDKSVCIYLRTEVDTLVKRLADEAAGRPLLEGTDLRSRIETLMAERSAIYESVCHHTVDTDGKSIEMVAQEILSALEI